MRFIDAALCSLAVLGGCRGSSAKTSAADSRAAATPVPEAPPSATAGKPGCPSTGLWSECAVFDRLDHAGLAPRRDSTSAKVELSPLTIPGARLLLGNAALEVFVYADASAREKDEARLDKSKYIDASDEPTLRGEATLIRNANLLAVLYSRNDHQRERVSDALTAGPPPRPSGNAAAPR